MHADREEDERLSHAAQLSFSTQQMTPIIKEELRLSIMKKRHDSGQEEIKVEFPEPRSYELTPHEKQKRERRREQNRRAAKKCRQKKKLLQSGKQEVFANIINQNSQLHAEVKTLRKEKRKLGDVLVTHLKSGCCQLAHDQAECLLSTTTSVQPSTPLSDNPSVYPDMVAQSRHISTEYRTDKSLPSFPEAFLEMSPSSAVDNDVFPPQSDMRSEVFSTGNAWSVSSDDMIPGDSLPEVIFDAIDSANDDVFYQYPVDKMTTGNWAEKVRLSEDLNEGRAWMEEDLFAVLCADQNIINPTSVNEP